MTYQTEPRFRGSAGIPLTVAAVLGALSVSSGARGDDDQRLTDIQEALRLQRAAIQSVTIQETLSQQMRELPDEMQQAVERFRAAAERGRQFALDRAGANAGQARAAQEAFDMKMSGVDRWPTALRLNKTILLSRKRTIDFGGARARLDDADLRDVARMVREHNLTERERNQLDQTQVRIIDAQRNAALSPGGAAFVTGIDRFNPATEHLLLGIIPARYFEVGLEFSVRDVQDDGHAALELTGRRPNDSFDRVRATLRPDRDYRFTRLATFNDNGGLSQSIAADSYQQTSGRWVPFHTRDERALRGVTDYRVDERLVSQVVINAATPDELFTIPETYNVTDVRTAERIP